jgi:hydrogenase maturation protease
MTATARVRLLVCGAADRGDDGVGLVAAATLLPTLDERQRCLLEVRRCGQLDVDDLLSLPEGVAALIVDAAIGVAPGSIVVVPIEELAGDGCVPAPRSSHALPISQVVGLAATLSDHPLRGSFVGIGGRRFGFGQSLSRCVRAALPDFRAAITAEIERLGWLERTLERTEAGVR